MFWQEGVKLWSEHSISAASQKSRAGATWLPGWSETGGSRATWAMKTRRKVKPRDGGTDWDKQLARQRQALDKVPVESGSLLYICVSGSGSHLCATAAAQRAPAKAQYALLPCSVHTSCIIEVSLCFRLLSDSLAFARAALLKTQTKLNSCHSKPVKRKKKS